MKRDLNKELAQVYNELLEIRAILLEHEKAILELDARGKNLIIKRDEILSEAGKIVLEGS